MRATSAVLLVSLTFGLTSGRVWASRESSSSEDPLRLLWIDPLEQASFAYPGLVQASTRALAGLGIAVHWEHVAAGAELQDGLRVVLLPRPAGRQLPHTMGLVTRQEAPVTHLYVFLNAVAEALGLEPERPAAWPLLERRNLGRALGRVVAHEVVHALRPRLPHAAHGLLATSLGRRELLDHEAIWDRSTRNSLATLSPWAAAAPARGFPAAFQAPSTAPPAGQP